MTFMKDQIKEYQRETYTSRIIGGAAQISLSEDPNVVNFRGPDTRWDDPIYINTQTGRTNLNLSGSVINNLTVLDLKVDQLQPYSGDDIVFKHGDQVFGAFQQNNDVVALQADVTGLKADVSAIKVQQTRQDYDISMNTVSINQLIDVTRQTTADLNALTTRVDGHDVQITGLQTQINTTRMYVPGQVVGLLRQEKEIDWYGSKLRIMDGTQQVTQAENNNLYVLFGGSGGVATIPDMNGKGIFAGATTQIGTYVGQNSVMLGLNNIPQHFHNILYRPRAALLYGTQDPSLTHYDGGYGSVNDGTKQIGAQTDYGDGLPTIEQQQAVTTIPRSLCVNFYVVVI